MGLAKLKVFCVFLSLLVIVFSSGCGSSGETKKQSQVINEDSTTTTIDEFNASKITFHDESEPPEDLNGSLYNTHAMTFLASVCRAESNVNIIVSPFSYFDIIGMVYHGAAGSTAEHLSVDYTFIDTRDVSEGVTLSHHFWGQSGYHFSLDYLTLMNTLYEPVFCGLDFLNDAADADTRIEADLNDMNPLLNMGETATSEIVPSTRVVMGNYFQVTNFSELFHDVEPFTGVFETFFGELYQGKHLSIHGEFDVFESDDMTVIQKNDPDRGLAVTFVFPESETLSPSADVFSIPLETKEITFSIPEFSIHTEYDATSDLDIDEPFSDFSRINGLGYLFVRSVLTEAKIKVDENGFHVSGMSSAVMEATKDEPTLNLIDGSTDWGDGLIMSSTPPELCINPDSRPFFFYIMDTQIKSILYTGYVKRPEGEHIGNRSSAYACGSSIGLEYLFGKRMIFVADRMADYSGVDYPVEETMVGDYTPLDESLVYSVDFSNSTSLGNLNVRINPGSINGEVVEYGPDHITYVFSIWDDTYSKWVLTVRLENETLNAELSFYGTGNCLEKSERGLLLSSESEG